MKKYVFPEVGNFYKANLHCHTTFSDGVLTPEQVKELYLANGYSIVAYTDHDNYYVKNKGVHPDSGCRWEDAATIRRRVLPVLQKYADVPKVIVIGHGMMIEAVTGVPHPNCGEIVPFSLVGKE